MLIASTPKQELNPRRPLRPLHDVVVRTQGGVSMKKNVSNVFRIARGANPGLLVLGVLCLGLLAIAPAASAQTFPV